jgi:hypothetical protein
LIHAVVPLARIVTTYRALDLGLGVQFIGLLSAVFALLPVFLAVACAFRAHPIADSDLTRSPVPI